MESERDEFEDHVRRVTTEKSSICENMVFALTHADSSAEIVTILTQSFSREETPMNIKVGSYVLVVLLTYCQSDCEVIYCIRYPIQ